MVALLQNLQRDVAQVDQCTGQVVGAVNDHGARQQLIEQPAQRPRARHQPVHGAARGIVVRGGEDAFGLHTDGGDGRAQLMRGVGDQIAHHPHLPVEPPHKPVHGGQHHLNLTGDIVGRDRGQVIGIAVTQVGGDSFKGAHRRADREIGGQQQNHPRRQNGNQRIQHQVKRHHLTRTQGLAHADPDRAAKIPFGKAACDLDKARGLTMHGAVEKRGGLRAGIGDGVELGVLKPRDQHPARPAHGIRDTIVGGLRQQFERRYGQVDHSPTIDDARGFRDVACRANQDAVIGVARGLLAVHPCGHANQHPTQQQERDHDAKYP